MILVVLFTYFNVCMYRSNVLKLQVPRDLRGCKGLLVALNESAARYMFIHLIIEMYGTKLFPLGMDVMKNSLQI